MPRPRARHCSEPPANEKFEPTPREEQEEPSAAELTLRRAGHAAAATLPSLTPAPAANANGRAGAANSTSPNAMSSSGNGSRSASTRPDADRPYRAVGYPVVPALYIAGALADEQAFPHAVGNPVEHMYQRVMRTRQQGHDVVVVDFHRFDRAQSRAAASSTMPRASRSTRSGLIIP